MQIKMASTKAGAIDLTSAVPVSMVDYVLPGSQRIAAEWQYGASLIQYWEGDPSIRYFSYLFYDNDALCISEDTYCRPFLQFVLQNEFYGRWAGLGYRYDPQWSCNMLTLPHFEYTLEGSEEKFYSKVEIYFSFSLLSSLSSISPLLQGLLAAAEKDLPSILFEHSRPVPPIILAGIGDLLQTSLPDDIRNAYMGDKSIRILMDTMRFFQRSPKYMNHGKEH